MLREIVLKNYKVLIKFFIPLFVAFLWMGRNQYVFGSFAMINPIMSSRALIGSLYGTIYHPANTEFHSQYNYYEGRDYVNKKDSVNKYKAAVKREVINALLHHPLNYLFTRLKQILYGFFYIGFNNEILPDQNWKFYSNLEFSKQKEINSQWSYQNLIENRDYLRLIIRCMYNGGLLFFHLSGVLFIFFNRKIIRPLLPLFINFWFILFIEVDMRYLITIQSISFCCGVLLVYYLITQKSLYFKSGGIANSLLLN
jgi:hypothetical protein